MTTTHETTINLLKFQKIKFRFAPEHDIRINAWPGAVIRNKFLYACSKVETDGGKSLFQRFKDCPLPADHPLFRRFSSGFPKPFLIDCRPLSAGQSGKSCSLRAGKAYEVEVVLLGSHTGLTNPYIQSMQLCLDRGWEHNGYPLQLLATEVATIDNLSYPPTATPVSDTGMRVSLRLDTPLSLLSARRQEKNTPRSFQDKMNGFPSFYQIIRSLLFRALTLDLLYGECQPIDQDRLDEIVEREAAEATLALLERADVRNYHVISTRKAHAESVYRMSGYVGNLVFENVHPKYVPLLQWGGNAGVGNDISFGLGLYTPQLL